jgi:hypothetical protein
VSRAATRFIYEGDMTGESNAENILYYRPDGSGTTVGFERITGTVGGKSGSFVIQHDGVFSNGPDGYSIDGTWTIVEGSGTDALQGLRGSGSMRLRGHQERYPFEFEYELD